MEKTKNILIAIEQNFDVNCLTYQGIEVWPLFRFSTMGAELKFNRTPKTGFFYELKRLWVLWKAKFRDANNNITLDKSFHYGIYCDALDRRITIEDKHFSRIAESFQYYAGKEYRALTFEMTHESIPANRFYPSYFIYSQVFIHLLKEKFKKKFFNGPKKHEIDNLAIFQRFLQEQNLDIDFDYTYLRQQAEKIIGFKKMFLKILKESNLKQFFIIAYYNNIKLGLILACKELGIPTIDIQHGLQGVNHLAYNSWYNVPKRGYKLLPDKFWVWSDLDKELIDRWFKHSYHKAIVGGNPWIAFYLQNAERIDPSTSNTLTLSGQRKFILLTIASLEEFVDHWIVSAMKDKDLEQTFLFSIRIHPAMRHQLKALELFLTQKEIVNAEIIQANTLPLYTLLKKCDYHLTFLSTVALEAFYFQKPSAVIHKLGKIYYQTEIGKGILQYLANKEDLITFTKQSTFTIFREMPKEIEKVQHGIDTFFPDNAKSQIPPLKTSAAKSPF